VSFHKTSIYHAYRGNWKLTLLSPLDSLILLVKLTILQYYQKQILLWTAEISSVGGVSVDLFWNDPLGPSASLINPLSTTMFRHENTTCFPSEKIILSFGNTNCGPAFETSGPAFKTAELQ
jgi:hypothetical protein